MRAKIALTSKVNSTTSFARADRQLLDQHVDADVDAAARGHGGPDHGRPDDREDSQLAPGADRGAEQVASDDLEEGRDGREGKCQPDDEILDPVEPCVHMPHGAPLLHASGATRRSPRTPA